MLFFSNNNNSNNLVCFRFVFTSIHYFNILLASFLENTRPKESISPVNLKSSTPIDCSSSDTNEKSALDDDDNNTPTIATTLATLPTNNSRIIYRHYFIFIIDTS